MVDVHKGKNMTNEVSNQIELSAVLDLVPYLDIKFDEDCNTLSDIVTRYQNNEEISNKEEFQILKSFVSKNEEKYGNIELVNQSNMDSQKVPTEEWTDDYIQGCTFKDTDGNYYVTYRGTGDGRWKDNGDGLVMESTIMQDKAKEYFDKMAKEYFVDAKAEGKKIIVTGHSKGGNEAQYVYMNSDYEALIDNCYSFDGQGFSKKAEAMFKKKYGERYKEKIKKMYSICGENDYVHDMGIVIIPEENTYFVKTREESMKDLHSLTSMIGDKNGNYKGLSWSIVDNKIVNGEQGEIGKLSKKMSEEIMKLDEADLRATASTLMCLIDVVGNNPIIGDSDLKTEDVKILLENLPSILVKSVASKEGVDVLSEVVGDWINDLCKKHGTGGVIGGFVAIVLGASIANLLICKVEELYVMVYFVTSVMAKIEKITNIVGKAKTCINDIYDYVINLIKQKIQRISQSGGSVVETHEISIDINSAYDYANQLRKIVKRISNLESRIDSLLRYEGMNIVIPMYNRNYMLNNQIYKLNSCINYLVNTAYDFETVENIINNSIQ